jgi:hypothetical protein
MFVIVKVPQLENTMSNTGNLRRGSVLVVDDHDDTRQMSLIAAAKKAFGTPASISRT